MCNAVISGKYNNYTGYSGLPELNEQISKSYSPLFKNAKQGQPLDPHTEIMVGVGATEVLFSALHNIAGPGDEVLLFEPFFTAYINFCNYAGCTLKGAPMFRDEEGNWQYDFEQFEALITDKTKAVIITNPHNPTGKIFTKEELERLTVIMDKYPKIIVISDDVYYFLPFDGRKHHMFADIGNNFQKTITVFSAGKMMNATGWRTGWGIGPKELIKYATLVHESSVFNAFVPGQKAVSDSLPLMEQPKGEHKDYYAYICSIFQKARDAAKEVVSHSKKIKFTPTHVESGYFMILEFEGVEHIPAKYFEAGNYEPDADTTIVQKHFDGKVPDDYALCRWAAVEKGIAMMPMSAFYLADSTHKTYN